MTAYELICDVNCEMIKGKSFSDEEKCDISAQLLAVVDDENTVKRFHRGVKAQSGSKHMYPLFYIPPYNNSKKLRLVTGELPKTHILSANHYELEALRILTLFDGDNPIIKRMIEKTLGRLKTTCYAHFCPTGECVGAGISVLRFLAVLSPHDSEWINRILTPMIALYLSDKGSRSNNVPVYYLFSAITDIADEQCRKLVESKTDWIIHSLGKGSVIGSSVGDAYNVIRLCILRNALSLLPEYEYMKLRPVYISEKNNRCYCDVAKFLC